MTTIVTRTGVGGKGTPLTHVEVDTNFTRLNTFKVEQTSDTGFAQLPAGTTAQRGTPAAGSLRHNTTDTQLEWYNGTSWFNVFTQNTSVTSLGATTLGANFFTLANVSAISFPRINANNTVSSLSAADFRTAIGAGTSSTTGTVTSVGGTGTVSGLTLTGTVTASGNLTLGGTLAVAPGDFASQTTKTFLAAPNAADGTPTFRTIVASDIPTLNQNTTGSAGSVTGTTTAAVATTALGSGTANSTTYLRGDRTWATVVSGASISNDITTNASYYPIWATSNTGTPTTVYVSDTKLYFNPSTGTLNATNFNSLSDATLKQNVVEIQDATTTIKQIDGVEFEWQESGKKSAGVIAQKLEEILPHLVETSATGIKSVNYSGLVAYLIQALKQQDSRITELERIINK